MDLKNSIKLNLVKSPVDKRDYTLKVKVNENKLPIVDNSIYCTVPKDQGSLGSCTAFATNALMEYGRKKFYLTNNENKDNKQKAQEQDVFSEKFTYYVTRVNVLNWTSNEDTGAYIKDALSSLLTYGTCLEKTCPYDQDFISKPSELAYNEAKKYQAVVYAKIEENPQDTKKTLEECKQVIAEGYGLVAGFICFDNIFNSEGGKIPEPSGYIVGGHAIFICGYDDNVGCFKIKNSWGESWGDKGYGYLPYSYLLQGYMWDIYTIIQQEDNNKVIGIQRPLLEDELKTLKAKIVDSSIRISNSNNQAKNMNNSIKDTIKSNIIPAINSIMKQPNVHYGVRQVILNHIVPRLNNIALQMDVTNVQLLQTDTELGKLLI